jgi:hypothetical protein
MGEIVTFLASGASSYINGADILADSRFAQVQAELRFIHRRPSISRVLVRTAGSVGRGRAEPPKRRRSQ